MRRSQRINSDITKLILDGEEIFDIEDVHDSVVREVQSKIGASKKRTIKTEVYNVEETKSDSEEEYDFSDFLEEEEEVEGGKTVKSQPKTKTKSKSKAKVKSQTKTLSRKKLNRSGQFFPSLDKASCDSQYKYNSSQHWRNFITEENKSIKRKNRLFRTKMTSYDYDTAANQLNLKLKQSSFDIQSDLKHGPKPDQCRLKIGGFLLPDSTSTILSPTEAIFRSSSDIFAICFCQCARCQRRTEGNFSKNSNSSKEIYFFVACSKEITIFAMILDPLNGITLAEKKGRIVLNSEDENRFVTMSVVQSLLCISTQQQFYFFECETFRSMNCEFIMSIDDSVPSPTPTYTYTQYGQINCHAWRDGKLAIGTSNGRLYVLNSEFKEIFQFSAPNEAPIYSLDWMNSFSILFAGRFSKIYSVDIRDPHYMMVEVSTLGTILFIARYLLFIIHFILTTPHHINVSRVTKSYLEPILKVNPIRRWRKSW